MVTARARLHGGRPRLHDGLSTSLALGTVASVVRQHAASSASAVYRALRADPSFALLLGASTSAFAVLAASQHARLAQRTRADAKGESKAGPAAVTWHDAKGGGKRKRYKVGGAQGHGHAQHTSFPFLHFNTLTLLLSLPLPHAPPRRGMPSQVDGSFFKQLAYLLRIAFGGRNATQGGPLLAAQMLLLLMRTQITVKTTKINVYYLTKVGYYIAREKGRQGGRENLARFALGWICDERHAGDSGAYGIDAPFSPTLLGSPRPSRRPAGSTGSSGWRPSAAGPCRAWPSTRASSTLRR